MSGNRSKTVRIIEIAELLGVTKQRAHQIADEVGIPLSGRRGRPRSAVGSAGGRGVGEAVATREALALIA